MDNMLEKFELLHLMGFENLKQQHIKYLEDRIKKNDKAIDQSMIENLKFMSIEEWEKSLSEKEIRKISKHTQDQRKILKRILETDLGLVEEQEVYDEIKFRKSSKGSAKFIPGLRFSKSISAPDLGQGFRNIENTSNPFPAPFNYNNLNIPSPPLKKFQSAFRENVSNNPFRPINSEYEGNEAFSFNKDSQYEGYKPFHFRQNFSHAFLDE